MKKLFKHPAFWGIIAALVVIVPQLSQYYPFGTDCIHIGVLEGIMDYPGMSPLNLYRFADGNQEHMTNVLSSGYFAWFSSLHWKIIFARHIPSLLMAVNHKISGMNPLGYIIHSLLWYIALIALLGLLFDRILGAPPGKTHHPASYLAVLMFTFSTSHLEILYYGATRWLLITAAFAVAGLLAHLKWREQNWKPGRYLSVIAFALALLSGEAALAALAFLAAYELFGSDGTFKKKMTALLPTIILVGIYLLGYKLMGYGTGGQSYYINPLNEPIAFLLALPVRVASMLGEMFFGTLSLFGLNSNLPSFNGYALLLGAGALVICGLLFFPAWKNASPELRRTFKWLIIGTFAAMIPLSSGYPCARVTIIPFMGGSLILASILTYWWKKLSPKKKIRENLKSPISWIAGLICIAFFLLHLGYSPYRFFTDPQMLKLFNSITEEFNTKNTVLGEIKPNQEVVFLNSDKDVDLSNDYFYYRKLKRLPMPRYWWQLSYSLHKQHFTRTAPNALELDITDGTVYDNYSSVYVLRSREDPMKPGDIIKLPGLHITILAVNPDGPTRLEFKFDAALEDARYRFFMFKEGKLLSVTPPPIGDSTEL